VDFTTWNDEVRRLVMDMPAKPGRGGAVIDAMIPYRLGWTPGRAARALMRYDRADHDTLHRLAIESAREPQPIGEPS
jgi:hypothetical protein